MELTWIAIAASLCMAVCAAAAWREHSITKAAQDAIVTTGLGISGVVAAHAIIWAIPRR